MSPYVETTFTPLSRNRYRCNQTGAILAHTRVEGYRRARTNVEPLRKLRDAPDLTRYEPPRGQRSYGQLSADPVEAFRQIQIANGDMRVPHKVRLTRNQEWFDCPVCKTRTFASRMIVAETITCDTCEANIFYSRP